MARKKTITAIDLSATVDQLLEEYGEEVFDDLDEVIEQTAEEAAKRLQSVKTFKPGRHPTGAYSAGWTQTERTRKRTNVERVVYNEDLAGLAHLLEFGHAKANGGRTDGFTHIKPVEEWVQNEIVEAFKRRAEQ